MALKADILAFFSAIVTGLFYKTNWKGVIPTYDCLRFFGAPIIAGDISAKEDGYNSGTTNFFSFFSNLSLRASIIESNSSMLRFS